MDEGLRSIDRITLVSRHDDDVCSGFPANSWCLIAIPSSLLLLLLLGPLGERMSPSLRRTRPSSLPFQRGQFILPRCRGLRLFCFTLYLIPFLRSGGVESAWVSLDRRIPLKKKKKKPERLRGGERKRAILMVVGREERSRVHFPNNVGGSGRGRLGSPVIRILLLPGTTWRRVSFSC